MKPHNYLALDVGRVRIGLARAGSIARLPQALPALSNDKDTFARLEAIVAEHEIDLLVVGLPRDTHGRETDQSRFSRSFARSLESTLQLPVVLQDETLSSHLAESRLKNDKQSYNKARIDSEAATLILQSYLDEVGS